MEIIEIIKKFADWKTIPNDAIICCSLPAFAIKLLDGSSPPSCCTMRTATEKFDIMRMCGFLVPQDQRLRTITQAHRAAYSWDVAAVKDYLERCES